MKFEDRNLKNRPVEDMFAKSRFLQQATKASIRLTVWIQQIQ